MARKTSRIYRVGKEFWEIRRTDYKWSPCWGVFRVGTDELITRDATFRLVRQFVRDRAADQYKGGVQ